MYEALVTIITTAPHPNADRLLIGSCAGFQVVAGINTPDGALGVFFPCDGQLTPAYCEANQLYPEFNDEGVRIGGGFIDPKNNRVRAQKFRGVNSEGLWMPMSSLASFGDVSTLKEGDTFTAFNDVEICSKWFNKATRDAIAGRDGSNNRKETPWLLMHPNTPQLKYNVHSIQEGQHVTVTEKLHGTCLAYNSRIKMYDGSIKAINKVQVGDEVVGMADDQLSRSVVTDVIKTPGGNSRWLKLYFRKGVYSKSDHILNCTRDHLIMVDGKGYVEAQNIQISDPVVSAIRYPEISPYGIQMLTGILLGDGSVSRTGIGWSIAFGHSDKQREYLYVTHKLLGDYAVPYVKQYQSGYGSLMHRTQTRHSLQINQEFGSFFDGNVKIVPQGFRFTAISLAYLYMDDGSLSHSESQKDRAGFAVCGFDEVSIGRLVDAFAVMGITAVAYRDTKAYFRIRLNTKDAYTMWGLIAPYIHPSMRYKLPVELRDVEYVDLSNSIQVEDTYFKQTLTLDKVEEDPEVHDKWDLTTTTHNFVANNVLVHNSQRSGWSWTETDVPVFSFLQPLMRFKWLRPFISKRKAEYVFLNGTRRVLVDSFASYSGYYSNENFRYQHERFLREALPMGYQVYYEVVGYRHGDGLVMPQCSNTKVSPEFVKQYGKVTRFTYGCEPGQSKIFAYAMTYTSPEGDRIAFSYNRMKEMCDIWGIPVVPKLIEFTVSSDTDIVELVGAYTEGPSLVDNRHIREGVCLQIRDAGSNRSTFLKNKSRDFYILEDIIKSGEAIDLEELESY